MKTLMKFKIDLKLHNWNEIIGYGRANKYYANSKKQQEMKNISYFMIGLPKITDYPVQMIFTWYVKNRGQDLDNKCVKSILDQMQIQGILENDNMKHINKITHCIMPSTREYVEVEVVKDDNNN